MNKNNFKFKTFSNSFFKEKETVYKIDPKFLNVHKKLSAEYEAELQAFLMD